MSIGRPRLDDVAASAGVSAATASLVLRDRPGPSAATRGRVLMAAAGLGYRADRSASLLARRRTNLLGVAMDVSSPFHAELLEDIDAAAAAQGYDIVVSPVTRVRGERQTVESLLDQRCEALLLLGPALPSAELAAVARECPLVVVGRRVRAPRVSVVRAADDVGVGLAVAHLVELGHRDIVFVDGVLGPIAALRRRGFREAMHRLLGVPDAIVVAGGDTEQAGAVASIAGPRGIPSAVVAFNDRCALGVIDQFRGAGLAVPGDVSVVGFDDSPVARLRTISLTTVSQAPREMAAAAVAAAVAQVGGEDPARRDVVLTPHLVLRTTTAPPVSG